MMRLHYWLAKLSGLLSKVVLVMIGFYRLYLSPIFGGACRFEPTCSCYAQQAFRSHSFLEALWLTVKRVSKCHPLGPYGPDPVPQRKTP